MTAFCLKATLFSIKLNMSKTLKAIFISVYCAIFLHSLKYLLFHRNDEISELNYVLRTPGLIRKMMREIKKSKRNSTVITMDFVRPTKFPTDLNFILRWNHVYSHPSQVYLEGQNAFINYNCTHFNCYLTSNKGTLVDIRYYDVILFDEESHWDEHPPLRAPYQKYIFTASESANVYSVCDSNYDNYYNLTWTYKLDSDIRRPTITVLDKNGSVVGPKVNMTWITPLKPVSEYVRNKIKAKKKAIAWFVSNCVFRNTEAHNVIENLKASLAGNKLALDIYGWCRKLKCPRDRIEECLALLRKDYFFYLAFETSLSEDYVSEEILYPLQNYAVPIVYGGANYSRFLPPGSYIDAGKLQPSEVVSLMITAMKHPKIYSQYFRWHNHYIYKEAPKDAGLCSLCKLLNNRSHNSTVIGQFRKWWNPKYNASCINKGKPILSL